MHKWRVFPKPVTYIYACMYICMCMYGCMYTVHVQYVFMYVLMHICTYAKKTPRMQKDEANQKHSYLAIAT